MNGGDHSLSSIWDDDQRAWIESQLNEPIRVPGYKRPGTIVDYKPAVDGGVFFVVRAPDGFLHDEEIYRPMPDDVSDKK